MILFLVKILIDVKREILIIKVFILGENNIRPLMGDPSGWQEASKLFFIQNDKSFNQIMFSFFPNKFTNYYDTYQLINIYEWLLFNDVFIFKIN